MDNTEARRAAIDALEKARGSRIIVYITGDREGAVSQIGMDVFPYFYRVLTKMGHVNQIDVLLYSRGGVTMAAWGLVNLIREFCKRFCVLIPFKAHSTATLMALGADEIVMSKLGQLSPVDPTITGPYNPMAPVNPVQPAPPQFLPVSVEDVVSYFDLAREEAKIQSESAMVEVFRKLSDTVQPIALGNVYRAREQIKLLSRQLLGFHMDKKKQKERIDSIVKFMTRELFSHDYLIGPREAKNTIKLKVSEADKQIESSLWSAFNAYAEAIQLNVPYRADIALGKETEKTVSIENAFVESTELGFAFQTTREIKKFQVGQGPGMPAAIAFQEQVLHQGWVETKMGAQG